MSTYYTADYFRQQAGGLTASAARESLRREGEAGEGNFDVFLSHSVRDATVILGLRNMLIRQGLRVYVDWVDDPEMDRSRVTSATAFRLRQRMRHSATLIYATSRAAERSRWMPWELGYFDGLRNSSKISIFPIENYQQGDFVGQEYLGLYKVVEQVRSPGGTLAPYAVSPTRRRAQTLRSFGKSLPDYVDLIRS